MKTSDFTTTLLVDQSPKEIMEAISQPQNWWPGEITGKAAQVDDVFTYRYEDMHYSKQKVVEYIPEKRLVWLVTESTLSFIEDKNEWSDTKIIFEITKEGDKTKLTFTHQGLVPEMECFNSCFPAWTQIIQQSLHSFITTGKGIALSLT